MHSHPSLRKPKSRSMVMATSAHSTSRMVTLTSSSAMCAPLNSSLSVKLDVPSLADIATSTQMIHAFRMFSRVPRQTPMLYSMITS
ncbi:hypothetical protein FOVG_18787 [Fusarium oxysporum f. sp. pisi HDV247]|uniref:Uncharacterized protein n=1 Tax=Fusarium oxysporum f. sp. pisi HDV247 TaxID=1080344 RepID=W9NAQ4_FUSOX|nr:hypothetical protein FOVG_18787 [Fusarium oxysporum f. sp. pisi HDV247]